MLSRKALAIASLSTIVCSGAALAEDGFKSSKFLTYAADAQKSYISTAVVAATTIASLNSAAQAKCLGSWITEHSGGGYQSIMDVMRKYPDDHPMGLIVAVLQRDCGPLKYVSLIDLYFRIKHPERARLIAE